MSDMTDQTEPREPSRAHRAAVDARQRAVDEHLALTPRQRMETGLRVARELEGLNRWGRRGDRPWELHERARQAGLWRG